MPIIDKVFSDNNCIFIACVDDEFDSMRLDQYSQKFLRNLSREKIKAMIDRNEITIDGRNNKLRPSTLVHTNDIVKISIIKTTHEDEYWNNELVDLSEQPTTVFEDNDLIVTSKPPFMSTHPTGKHLFYCATVFYESIHKKTIHSIHRIDRETSGLLLLGKNSEISGQLANQFETKNVQKCYFFISKIISTNIDGAIAKNESNTFWAHERLDNPEEKESRVFVEHYPESSSEGKHAETFFKIIYRCPNNEYAIGLAFPKTGRQHQIRVHAMVHGFPLIGDKIYLGGVEMFKRFKDNLATASDHEMMLLPRHALHALAIKIHYKGELKTFFTSIPNDLLSWIKSTIAPIDKKLKIEKLDNLIHETINETFSSNILIK